MIIVLKIGDMMKMNKKFNAISWTIVLFLFLTLDAAILFALDDILDSQIMFILSMFWLSSMVTGIVLLRAARDIDIYKGRVEVIKKKRT